MEEATLADIKIALTRRRGELKRTSKFPGDVRGRQLEDEYAPAARAGLVDKRATLHLDQTARDDESEPHTADLGR
jgi:hypothetical protein